MRGLFGGTKIQEMNDNLILSVQKNMGLGIVLEAKSELSHLSAVPRAVCITVPDSGTRQCGTSENHQN